ncbi:hypothetical protein DW058_15955 [Clostridiaceae bacterium AF42-6]|nr:hypothetical protein DW058_15955 [Clostridiaceae bacterium AF42-6]
MVLCLNIPSHAIALITLASRIMQQDDQFSRKNMKQKNILFTDMDGTILFSDNGKTYFKESDLDAIKEFQQRGNLIVINSGRALPWIVAPLEGYLLPDYMIAGTGSIIADSHQQILHEEPVSFTAIKKIINEYASDIPLTVHTKDNVFSCNQKKQYSLPITPISSIDLLKTENFMECHSISKTINLQKLLQTGWKSQITRR